jgi:hypothetical protein
MAPRIETVTFQDRDRTLTFQLTEMPALKRERFAYRLAGVLAPATADEGKGLRKLLAGEGTQAEGTEALWQVATGLGKIDIEGAVDLLDELFSCAKRVLADGKSLQDVTVQTLNGYIEDMRTLIRLRYAILRLNAYDFFPQGGDAGTPSSPAEPSGNPGARRKPQVSVTTPT